MTYPRPIELLAPAKNAETAIEAIKHGADAIYIGAPTNGARAAAANSIADIRSVVQFAHLFNARVYVTVNTIIYDHELKAVEKMIQELYKIGVDAIIVQDMAVLNMNIPPIALHASTQCDTRTPDKAKFLEAAGFSQIVPARELTIEETAAICSAVNVPVEVFVHGALCVSYSGACYASLATTGRSANRGECAQLCRLPYTLYDKDGKELIKNRHLLSLKDLNRIADIEKLLTAGVTSFKIEGRLKDVNYVKNVVAAYREAIDSIIKANPELYTRASSGTSRLTFTPDLSKSFNRGFTGYFTGSPQPSTKIASFNSPKWIGEKIGTVRSSSPSSLIINTRETINNGDGLGYFDTDGKFCGFRVNKAEGGKIYPANPVSLSPGTEIFRNNNKSWNDKLSADTATRTLDIEITLRVKPDLVIIDIKDEDGNTLTATAHAEIFPAAKPQETRQNEILAKTGATIYKVVKITNLAAGMFIPSSILTSLRRDALEKLDKLRLNNHKYTYRLPAKPDVRKFIEGKTLSAGENISNAIAEKFYRDLGAKAASKAFECNKNSIKKGTPLMTTRYCLRRECGKCLKTPEGAQWKAPLTIKSGNYTFTLTFDCANCRMNVNYI